eukprot:g14778.t1
MVRQDAVGFILRAVAAGLAQEGSQVDSENPEPTAFTQDETKVASDPPFVLPAANPGVGDSDSAATSASSSSSPPSISSKRSEVAQSQQAQQLVSSLSNQDQTDLAPVNSPSSSGAADGSAQEAANTKPRQVRQKNPRSTLHQFMLPGPSAPEDPSYGLLNANRGMKLRSAVEDVAMIRRKRYMWNQETRQEMRVVRELVREQYKEARAALVKEKREREKELDADSIPPVGSASNVPRFHPELALDY